MNLQHQEPAKRPKRQKEKFQLQVIKRIHVEARSCEFVYVNMSSAERKSPSESGSSSGEREGSDQFIYSRE